MARIEKGVCPSCFKDRELASFKFGVISCTMCVHCITRYLNQALVPMVERNNRVSDDNYIVTEYEYDS